MNTASNEANTMPICMCNQKKVSLQASEFDVRRVLHRHSCQSNKFLSWAYERLQKSKDSLKGSFEIVTLSYGLCFSHIFVAFYGVTTGNTKTQNSLSLCILMVFPTHIDAISI